MSLKKESIRIASQPTKIVQKIDRAVNNFKPINAHRSEVLYPGKNFIAISKHMLYFERLRMILERRQKARKCGMTKTWYRMHYFLHLKSISTTISRTWSESLNSQW